MTDVWGPTDVYGVTKLPDDAKVLLRGSVLTGMSLIPMGFGVLSSLFSFRFPHST